MLAEAPSDGGLFLNHHLHRGTLGALMTAIAKWLMGGLTAGAPPVSAGLHLLNARLLAANFRRFHIGNLA